MSDVSTREGRVGRLPALFAGTSNSPPQLLFLHGVMSRAAHFTNYLQYFSGHGWPGCAISLRGRDGLPPLDAQDVLYQDYLEDARLAARSLHRPVLVGHSMGSLLAQQLASEGLARALILIAPVPPGYLRRPPLSATRLFLEALPSILSGNPMKPSLASLSRITMPLVPPPGRSLLYKDFSKESGLVLRRLVRGVPVDTRKITCPVLCVAGLHDGICPPTVALSTASQYQASLLVYPGHDHWFLDEPNWEVPASDMLRWLDREVGADRSTTSI